MHALLLTLLLAAAPDLKEADSLAARGDAETLFLKYSSLPVEECPEGDRPRLAKALFKAAKAKRKDAVVALGLLDKSVQLSKSAEALELLAELESGMDQRGAAARHLDEALELEPKRAAALMARGELAMHERDFAVAVDRFERAAAAGVKGAAPKAAKAKAELARKEGERGQLEKAEQDVQKRVAAAARNATKDWIRQVEKDDEERTAKRRLAPDGVRQGSIDHFTYTYSTGEKNTGQMLSMESKVERLLEKAYEFCSDQLGHKLAKKVAVALLSRKEFAEKTAGTPMARAAGYWDGHQIVINGGADVNAEFAEVMVHELTHAMVTDLAGSSMRVPRWLNEGLAENVRLNANGQKGKVAGRERALLVGLNKADKLPKLAQLDPMFAAMSEDVHVAYVLSGEAVRLLVERRNYSQMLELLRELGRGKNPATALESHFMAVERLESELADELR